MSKNNTALLGAAAGLALAGGALLFARQAKAEKPDDDDDDKPDDKLPDTPKTDDKLPDKPKQGEKHATIGRPYVPGDEATNVRIAVQTKPLKHPVGLSRGSKPWDAWLANVAFWETYPAAPITIPAKSEYAPKWVRIRDAVRRALAAEKKDSIPSGHPTIGTPYKPGRSFERHNATEAVKHRPGSHPVGKSGATTSADWLTNVAFWESYPKGPVVIPAGDKEASAAWLRIRGFVRAELAKGTSKKDDKKDSLFPTLGSPYRPGSDQERANAVIAVRTMPSHHPRGEARRPGQADADWLANIVFWESWPAAPTRLAKNSPLAPAWIRGRNYVIAELAKAKAAKSKPKSETKPKGETKPKSETKPKGETKPKSETKPKTQTPQTDGTPGDLEGNARLAVARLNTENDRANAAYWWTWPDAPRKIAKGDKTNAKRWLSARDAVRRLTSTSSTTPSKPSTSTTPAVDGKPGDLDGNARLAVARYAAENDRANAAYWWTWPDAPRKIAKGDKTNAKRWLSARDAVRKYAGVAVSGAGPLRPSALASLPKDSLEGARELASAIRASSLAVTPGQATVQAYRDTYGPAPVVPTVADKTAAERILQHVRRTRALWRSLQGQTPAGLDEGTFRRIAAVLAGASQFRRPDEIADRVKAATETITAGEIGGDPVAMIAHRAAGGEKEPTRAWYAAREL